MGDDNPEMLNLGLEQLDVHDDDTEVDEASGPSTSHRSRVGGACGGKIDYAQALDELKKWAILLENIGEKTKRAELQTFKDKMGFIYSWKQLVDAVENESGLRGLPPDDISLTFKLITSVDMPATYGQKQRLVLSMIPRVGKIDDGFLTEILNWIYVENGPNSRSTESKIIMTFLQYLNGLLEYELVSPKILQTPFIYGLLFPLHKYEVLTPWLCRLLIKVTSKKLVQRHHILELMDFLPKDLTPTCRLSIMELLRYYKCLRPDLFPNDLPKVFVPSKGIKIKLDPKFRKRLYEANLRASGSSSRRCEAFVQQKRLLSEYEVDGVAPTPPGITEELNDTVRDFYFPEFPLQDGPTNLYNMENLKRMSKLDIVRAAIGRSDTLFFIVKDSEALEVFNTWLALILHHKFGSYTQNEVHRFDFLLRRCVQLSIMMEAGLAAVDDWLPGYFLSWNGIFKRQEILELLAYTNPNALQDGLPEVLGPLESCMLDGDPSEQVEIWLTLTDMLVHWFKITPLDAQIANDVIGQVLIWLSTLISKFGACEEDITWFTMAEFCATYTKLLKIKKDKGNGLEPYPPFALWWMVVLSDSLFALEAFCKMMQAFESLEVPQEESPGFKHMKKLAGDVAGFFRPPGTSCLNELFKHEHKFFRKQFKKLQREENTKAQEALLTLDERNAKLNDAVIGINVQYVKCLRSYRSNKENQAVLFDKHKLRQDAPALLHYLEEFNCTFK